MTESPSSFSHPSIRIKQKLSMGISRKPFSQSLPTQGSSLPPVSSHLASPTYSNQSLYQSKKRAKTQAIPSSQQPNSPGERQLSRFIFNHLQKKIEFQEKQHDQGSERIDRGAVYQQLIYNQQAYEEEAYRRQSKPKAILPFYSYENPKNKTACIKIEDFLKPQKLLKFKMKNRQRTNLLNLMHQRQSKRQTHIDSYFDLSCLKQLPTDNFYRNSQTKNPKNASFDQKNFDSLQGIE